ncbi:cytidine deaminase [Aquimarina sp. AD10]|uniref:Cytidine deaminase n=1 Tax=Aquimarina aggregata TaxID=1642818 RepID=A0A162FBM1_9FLAO|nr:MULTISPECIES: cytidine deaminase [Aquimarina]AXT62861.1 cytidine deaminase [Aquimarina sp. AD10]KZS40806.1 cytidine deaminase [Aquimarina aggregata]RKM94229.1 cytidine deaminase [Aquimarina sp. AD10]
MKEIEIKSTLQVYDSFDELPKDIQQLMQKSMAIRDKAYAPYSEFLVGAALLLENGEVVLGNNQENACYPSGLCAERTAIYYAGANYPDVPVLIMALTAKSLKHQLVTPTPPCGACRQSIAEYELKQNKPITIYFMGETGKVVKSSSLSNLLPLIFDNSYL